MDNELYFNLGSFSKATLSGPDEDGDFHIETPDLDLFIYGKRMVDIAMEILAHFVEFPEMYGK